VYRGMDGDSPRKRLEFGRRLRSENACREYLRKQQTVVVEPVPYKNLIKHVRAGSHHKKQGFTGLN